METMKLNFILYSTERTGGTRTILNYANEFSKFGHEVTITTLYHDPWFNLNKDVAVISKKTKLSLYKFYISMRINNKRGKGTSLSSEFTLLRNLASMAPKADINVVTFYPTAYVASWLSDRSVPFYLLMHDPDYFVNEPLQKKFYNDTLFLPINKIVNSTWLQDRIYEKTNVRYPVMNMGAVGFDLFKPNPLNGSVKKEQEIHIVSLGKGGFKNSKFVYEAVKIVRERNPDIQVYLHFFGHRLPKDIQLDKFTVFHKDLTDAGLSELYSNSDIQVTTSTAESFPLPPLEAMASGCTVITTPYGTEDYAVDGENCLTVRPNDVDDLVNKLELLILNHSLRNKLREEGFRTVRRFNYVNQARMLENFFKSKSL